MTPEQRTAARRSGQPAHYAPTNPMKDDPEVVTVLMSPQGPLILEMSKVGLTFLRQLPPNPMPGGWEAAHPEEQAAHLMMTSAMVQAARRIKAQRGAG